MNIHALFTKINELDVDAKDKNTLKSIINLAVRDYIRLSVRNIPLPEKLVLNVSGVSLEQTPTLSNLDIIVVPSIDDNGSPITSIWVPSELLNSWGKTSVVGSIQQK